MINTDVAIIGAGPGGSLAAQRLAAAGAQVTLLEQEKFPRDKTCGDCVTAKGLAVLERSGLGEWAELFLAIGTMRFSSPDGQILDIPQNKSSGGVSGRLIPRRVLDARLAQSASDAGACLMDGVPVRKVDLNHDGGVRVQADGIDIQARLVILADGSNAPLTRSLGLVGGQPDLLAVRQYLVGDAGPADRLEMHFQNSIIPGYNWLFPVGSDHVNIGTGTYTSRVRKRQINLQKELARFATHPVIEGRLVRSEPLGPIKGHPLRTSVLETRTHTERAMVVGDAAGLVGPFTGEGIAAALISGELAARQAQIALAKGDFSAGMLAPYTQAIRGRYQADQQAARILRRVLKFPFLLNRAFQRMRQDEKLAVLFNDVFLDKKSPCLLLRPRTLLRLII